MARLSVFLCFLSYMVYASALVVERQASSYAPVAVQCPPIALTRSVKHLGDISGQEQNFYDARKPIAQNALKSWLNKIGKQNNITFETCEGLPVLGLAVSGGGDRSALVSAGVIQAFDNRESTKTSVSGLFQAFTYYASLSGGGELSGAFERLNWPTVTELVSNLWGHTLTNSRLYPYGTKNASQPAYAQIERELKQKRAAGFRVSLSDAVGRLYSYAFFGPPNGSPSFLMSNIPAQPNFTQHLIPFPIHMSVDMSPYGPGCPQERTNNTQYEMTPYEFGSWDTGVASFMQMKYLGSMPASKNLTCVNGFDRLGYIVPTSGDSTGLTCLPKSELLELENLTDYRFNFTQEVTKSPIPNPFFGSISAPGIKDLDYLLMADGGGALTGVSVWPLIHRPFIDVIFVNDNSNATGSHPNGTLLYNTYTEAQKQGILNMPQIPPPSVFVEKGYYKQNVFFGCNDSNTRSLVYMPDTNYSYNTTDISTSLTSTMTTEEIDAAIANGGLIANYNNAADWPLCVACLVMKKTNNTLPGKCQQCFNKYCVT